MIAGAMAVGACAPITSELRTSGGYPGAKLDNSAGGYVLPTDATPPDLSFAVGTDGTFFTIPGEDLKFADAGNGMSFGAVQSRGSGIQQDILGDVRDMRGCRLRV